MACCKCGYESPSEPPSAGSAVRRRGRGYIANQNDLGRMSYAEAKRGNYRIGTGITEAAAKTLASTRMKRAGARFSQHGGQTVLLFRAAIRSDRFDALHEELGTTYRKKLRIAA